TIYHLLPYFLDPTATEEHIGNVHGLTADEVAAARAYVLNNADTVLAEHLQIEDRIAEGSPPHIAERAKQTHERFVLFKEWLDSRKAALTQPHTTGTATEGIRSVADPFPTFQEWVDRTDSRPVERP